MIPFSQEFFHAAPGICRTTGCFVRPKWVQLMSLKTKGKKNKDRFQPVHEGKTQYMILSLNMHLTAAG